VITWHTQVVTPGKANCMTRDATIDAYVDSYLKIAPGR